MNPTGDDRVCARCGTTFAPGAALCSNCGGVFVPGAKRASAAPAVLLGILVGAGLAFVVGFLTEFARSDGAGHFKQSFWSVIWIQVAVIVATLVGGVAARRAGRRGLSFFMISAGVAAIVPTAACDAIWW